MAQTDFAGAGVGAAADEARVGNRMVRRSEWPRGHKRRVGIEQTRHRVDLGCFQRFVKGAIGKN